MTNTAKQSSEGMSEVQGGGTDAERQAHTLARLSPYFAKGYLTASSEIGERPFLSSAIAVRCEGGADE